MTIWPYTAAFALIWIAMLCMAGALWVELHREARRRRLVRDIAAVLADEDFHRPPQRHFQRVA